MPDHDTMSVKASTEQINYANILFLGAWLGILLLVITYLIYITGILAPHVPMKAVTANWGQGVNHFVETTNAPHGWKWVALLGTGDYLNFVGVALLALLTVVCYLTLLPGYARRGDWVYFVICALEVIVLCVAASGMLGAGGH